jgi:hypothetical protein
MKSLLRSMDAIIESLETIGSCYGNTHVKLPDMNMYGFCLCKCAWVLEGTIFLIIYSIGEIKSQY